MGREALGLGSRCGGMKWNCSWNESSFAQHWSVSGPEGGLWARKRSHSPRRLSASAKKRQEFAIKKVSAVPDEGLNAGDRCVGGWCLGWESYVPAAAARAGPSWEGLNIPLPVVR